MNPSNSPVRLAVMVSGGGTTMQNLAEVIARGELNAQIKDWDAAAVILVHNHPTGVATPSPADVELTKQIIAAGNVPVK